MSLLSKVLDKFGYKLLSSEQLQSILESNQALERKLSKQKETLGEMKGYIGNKFKIKDASSLPQIKGQPIRFHLTPDIYGKSAHKLIDIREFEPFFSLAQAVVSDKDSMLYYDRLYTLYQALENTLSSNKLAQEPCFTVLEAGVYRGGGSYFMASVMQALAKPGQELKLYSVDTFEGHSDKDLPNGEGANLPGMFDETDYEQVKNYLSGFPFVQVIKGRIQECESLFADQKFDLIHLDMDIYHPTLYSLNHYKDKLKPWGMLILDDYCFKTCPGVKQAVEDFLAQQPGQFHMFFLLTGQCVLVKVAVS